MLECCCSWVYVELSRVGLLIQIFLEGITGYVLKAFLKRWVFNLAWNSQCMGQLRTALGNIRWLMDGEWCLEEGIQLLG